MSRPTPGPWYYRNNNHSTILARTGSGEGKICVLQNRAEFGSNARLIAAAPELLECLKNLAGLASFRGGHLHEYKSAVTAANAAIAKAEGASK